MMSNRTTISLIGFFNHTYFDSTEHALHTNTSIHGHQKNDGECVKYHPDGVLLLNKDTTNKTST